MWLMEFEQGLSASLDNFIKNLDKKAEQENELKQKLQDAEIDLVHAQGKVNSYKRRLDELKRVMRESLLQLHRGDREHQDRLTINQRHERKLSEAIKRLNESAEEIKVNSSEIAAMLLRQAHEQLGPKRPYLLLVGAGTERFQGERLIGLGARGDIPRWLNAADILVNPSRTESAPNAVLEAMSCERPCIVTDVGASRDYVGETGWVCDASVESLVQAMQSALANDAHALLTRGVDARKRVESAHAIDTCLDAYQALYQRIARGAS